MRAFGINNRQKIVKKEPFLAKMIPAEQLRIESQK